MTRLHKLAVACVLFIATVESAWLSWGPYSACSTTCNPGFKSRSRKCDGDLTTCDGRNEDMQSDFCFVKPCEVSGEYGPFGPWSQCSGYCGAGLRKRTKYCTNGFCQSPFIEEVEACSSGECRMATCPANPGPCDCNFEDMDSCKWRGDGTGAWRVSSYTPSVSTGPDHDHTFNDTFSASVPNCGHFAYYEASGFGKGQVAFFASPDKVASVTSQCISFYVSMYAAVQFADQMGSLTVRVWEKSGGTSTPRDVWYHNGVLTTSPLQWKGVNIDLSVGIGVAYYITFMATNGETYNSDIAVDDIVVADGKCTGPVDGNWGKWGSFGTCSVTCGEGYVTRSRVCDSPSPANNGAACVGNSTQTTLCSSIGVTNPLCPVTGGWNQWTNWTSCSLSCGSGVQSRQRECSDPSPANGGASCIDMTAKASSEEVQSRACNTDPCNRDGNWSEYTQWSSCAGSCGTGVQTRSRQCTNPTRLGSGKLCLSNVTYVMEETVSQSCNTGILCPVNGAWGAWLNDGCTVTCGEGFLTKRRYCNDPQPANNGSQCQLNDGLFTTPGNLYEEVEEKCIVTPCAVNGNWSAWQNTTGCSVTCGVGIVTEQRACNNPAPVGSGSQCVGNATRVLPCNSTVLCPIHGNWTKWTSDTCTAPCGGGFETLTRYCSNPPPLNGGTYCQKEDLTFTTAGNIIETKEVGCNNHSCPVNGNWSAWQNTTGCSVTCGVGVLTEQRACNNPAPAGNGSQCVGNATRVLSCNSTVLCPIHGNWTKWTSDTCTTPCGGGFETLTRYCSNPPPSNGGTYCQKEDLTFTTAGNIIETKEVGCNNHLCPVNGNWSAWQNSSTCSVTCGVGHITQVRFCNNPTPVGNGSECVGNSTRSVSCDTGKNCPINGNLSAWGDWMGNCSDVTCGLKEQVRVRDCTNPAPQFGGTNCVGITEEKQNCSLPVCPVNGNWSVWNAVGTCSKTCGGGGLQSEVRTCTNPAPQGSGLNCTGNSTRTVSCGNSPCPINGNFSAWSNWIGNCSEVTCGVKELIRVRDCNSPLPQFGGNRCVGATEEKQNCSLPGCPVDGGWTNWTTDGVCSVTCGNGSINYTRTCTNPPVAFNGLNCSGNSTRTEVCSNNACPVVPEWSAWSNYSTCTQTCDSGNKTRTRTCDKGVCPGNSTEVVSCFLAHCPDANDCSFEGASSQPSTCNLMYSSSVPNRWNLISGPTPTTTCGPNNDHTYANLTGHYMYFETSKRKAITSEIYPSDIDYVELRNLAAHTKQRCVQFYFHMYERTGLNIQHGPFYVFHIENSVNTTLLTETLNVVDEWVLKSIDLPPASVPYTLRFSATKTSESTVSDKAIDDIKFYNVPCNEIATAIKP